MAKLGGARADLNASQPSISVALALALIGPFSDQALPPPAERRLCLSGRYREIQYTEAMSITPGNHTVDISMGTILRWLLLRALFFHRSRHYWHYTVALIFSAAIDPGDSMQRRRIPRSLSIVILFAITVALSR